MRNWKAAIIGAGALAVLPASAFAQDSKTFASGLKELKTQLDAQRLDLERQRMQLELQRAKLQRLEDNLLDRMRGMGMAGGPALAGDQPPAGGASRSAGVETVGPRPAESKKAPEVAVLGDQGGILSSRGRITIEPSLDYARADRNRFVFRGIEVPQSVLVGVFDINQSGQDLMTAALTARYGVSSRMEVSVKVPGVYRHDTSVLVPLVQNPPDSGAGTVNQSTNGFGLGDIELNARYQLTNGTHGWPFIIAGLQVLVPTGRDPFSVRRDGLGNARQSATGAGFWGVSPSVTLLVPSDPATIFGSIGYTYNFGRKIKKQINNAIFDRITPGGSPQATFGIGLSLNQALSISFAYAHSWQMPTKSIIRPISINNGVPTIGDAIKSESRDLQIGRFLFGVSYRLNPKTTINWTMEMGVTDDANDVRTTLRIPFQLN